MDDIKGIRTLVLNDPDAASLREKVRHYFHQTYTIDEMLYEQLAHADVFYKRADPLRHPLIFYLGHTAVFYINKLNIGRVINERVNPAFESMFAVGVDEMSWDDLNPAHYDWPPVKSVLAYRELVRAKVDHLISNLPLDAKGITWDSPWWAIIMGIEHQRIHLETSSVLIRQLPLSDLRPMDFWAPCTISGEAPRNELIGVAGGKVRLGRDDSDPLYGWDNEYGSLECDVADFSASRYLVSNAEFMEFVEAGAYGDDSLWTEEGRAWRDFKQARHPIFWHREANGTWQLRLVASMIPMPWDWPVEVNYLEAKAFCNWKARQTGKPVRLPSEEEWYRLRDLHLDTDQPWWDKAPGNINLEHFASSCPVTMFRFGEFYDVIGNVWQWTETPIYPFPGFKVHPIYDDFSVPTFDTRHNLIKGGSWISTGNEAVRNSRYAFRRHFFQHAGFRYVEGEAAPEEHAQPFESDSAIIRFCAADWNAAPINDLKYHERLMIALQESIATVARGKALHIGCKTGRGTFALARYFDAVLGLDFTARLIRVATDMKEQGFIRYMMTGEGENHWFAEARLEDFGLRDSASKVEFWQADASNLTDKYRGYCFILAENVISEAIDPVRFLHDIHTRLISGGILAIVDHYERDNVLVKDALPVGGYRKDGEPFSFFEGLTELLQERFELIGVPVDIWRSIPEKERCHSLRKQQLSIWKLK
jgi:5-histidylcysteine sulfoxide synthase/putative 4-mercaptohistidine N1-methyltranferase